MKVSIRERRIAEARQVLAAFGLPKEQQNERAALTLLALLDLPPQKSWAEAAEPLQGVTPIMEFAAKHYKKNWAPNTRETVRRFTLHQFAQAGFVVANPDEPDRPTNSPLYCYQIEPRALSIIRKFGTNEWDPSLRKYLADTRTLSQRYAQVRDLRRIPLVLISGKKINLSPGKHNALIKKIVSEFVPATLREQSPFISVTRARNGPISMPPTLKAWAFPSKSTGKCLISVSIMFKRTGLSSSKR